MATVDPKVAACKETRSPEARYRERSQVFGNFKPKGVCSTCNNGWMSELETEAKPTLGPIVQDLSIQLDLEDQTKIARWAFKTTIVLEGTKERGMKRYFESGLGPGLRTSGHILGRTMIWIGRSSESGLYARASDIGYNLDGRHLSAVATVTTMVVGQVVFQVVSAAFPAEKDAETVGIPIHIGDWGGYWWDGRRWDADEWDAVVSQPPQALRLRLGRRNH